MMFLTSVSPRWGLVACLLAAQITATSAEQTSGLEMQAVIANRGLGCELKLPESTLQFKPLQSSQLSGAVQTYQVKPLRLLLACNSEQQALLPTLTIDGETPYADDLRQVIFLNGAPNGVGFMLRQSPDNSAIDLANFYQPDIALGQGKDGQTLTLLDEENHYQSDTLLWVGLVGPFQPEIIPGHFHASLTLNVAFE